MRRAVSVVALAALAPSALLAGCALGAAAPTPTPTTDAPGPVVAVVPLAIGSAAAGPNGASSDPSAPLVGEGAVDTTGGSIPDGQTVSPFDDANPVVGLLDPLVRNAIQQAAKAASTEGVDVELTSGWRSKGFQRRLLDQAVATYGNADAASQFVASPDTSMHVLGKAVDVGPPAADAWMSGNGARFGLCQIYANEIWHFELAVDGHGNCPPLRPNAAG